MVGVRSPDRSIEYLVEPAARRYGESVAEAADSPKVAYARRPPIVPARSPWPEITAG